MEARKQPHQQERQRKMSDSDTESQFESFRSALQSDSPRSDASERINRLAEKVTPPVVVSNRPVREEELAPRVTKLGHASDDGGAEGVFSGGGMEGGGMGGERRLATPRRGRRVKKAELGLRLSEVIVCMISFWVMVADKARGWSGDSFDRYKEFRYCAAVTVIAFVYSTFQASYLLCVLITGKHIIFHPFQYHFNFSMDQIMAYLLISALSSAATRAEDWVSNWGEDVFTEMATVSVGMSFLAFSTFALSSLLSGHNLCNCTAASS